MLALPQGVVHLAACHLGPPLAHSLRRVAVDISDSAIAGRALHDQLTAILAKMIGAKGCDLALSSSMPVALLQAISAAVSLCAGPDRRIILTDDSTPPALRHRLAGIAATLGRQLRVVEPHCICYALTDEVALLFLAQIDARSGKRRDISCFSRQAHEAGALTLWDLSDSVGTLPITVAQDGADFAIGATDRYLLGRRGAPPFLWIAPRFAERIVPAIPGPLPNHHGPRQSFDRIGDDLPHPAALRALGAAFDLRDGHSSETIETASAVLSQRFLAIVQDQCPEIEILSPLDPQARGSHITLRHPCAIRLIHQLAARGIVADLHEPDLLRFAFSPLYNHLPDVDRAGAALRQALSDQSPPIP